MRRLLTSCVARNDGGAVEHRRRAGRPYVARNGRTLHGGRAQRVTCPRFRQPSGAGRRRRVILPKPASVHARVPAGRPWPMAGAHHACTCVCSVLSPGSHGNGHGRKPRACPHLGRRTPTAATGRAVFGSPTQPPERLGNRAQQAQPPPLLRLSSVLHSSSNHPSMRLQPAIDLSVAPRRRHRPSGSGRLWLAP
jgi:hypothetical protein